MADKRSIAMQYMEDLGDENDSNGDISDLHV
jgi:hypothetical protein